VQKRLEERGINAVVPLRVILERRNSKWINISRVCFPSYVFVIIPEFNFSTYYAVRENPNVIRFLGDKGKPEAIREEEISFLLELSLVGEPIGISNIVQVGEHITVTSGPLVGHEGKIIKIDARRFRAKVQIEIMGQARQVELAINVIAKS